MTDFGKGRTREVSEKTSDCLGLEGREGRIEEDSIFINVRISHYKLPKPTECTSPRVNCDVNFGFW